MRSSVACPLMWTYASCPARALTTPFRAPKQQTMGQLGKNLGSISSRGLGLVHDSRFKMYVIIIHNVFPCHMPWCFALSYVMCSVPISCDLSRCALLSHLPSCSGDPHESEPHQEGSTTQGSDFRKRLEWNSDKHDHRPDERFVWQRGPGCEHIICLNVICHFFMFKKIYIYIYVYSMSVYRV